ncbi:MAG TPA: hypothetical protein VHB69_09695 [Mycobacteriales bacterium]|nr:hypothetical protein [Mycobacteriales bacterium]
MQPAVTLTRRALLGAGLLFVAACKHPSTAPGRAAAPDAAALSRASAAEADLLRATTDPAQFAEHVQHYVALGGSAADYPAPPALPAGAARHLLRRSVSTLRAAAISAADGADAATFASIAAAHRVMLGG